jgi:hypothetical protein
MTEYELPDEDSAAAVEDVKAILEWAKPEDRAHFEALKAVLEAGPETIAVKLSQEQLEAVIYALRREAHRQDPAAYPYHKPAYPVYDPWPNAMAKLADGLEALVMRACLDGGAGPARDAAAD